MNTDKNIAVSDEDLNLLADAYCPHIFREQGNRMVDRLADHLEAMQSADRSGSVIKHITPAESLERWRASLEQSPQQGEQWWDELIADTIHLHHPRYMGHQICPPVPIAALAGLFSDFLNNGMGVYEMGEGPTSIERAVVDWMTGKLGLGAGSGGFLTSGGTLGNLTAMLTARRAFGGQDVWQDGVGQRQAIMVSEQAHYCIDRAARVMGMGSSGVAKVPVDKRFKMRTELLEEVWKQNVEQGITPIAVVGSACSTSTGSYDDLEAIASFCESKGLWFHVDGAHGASAALSEQYAHLVRGVERANSVVVDFHKTMMTPALATVLIYRDYQNAYQTFSQEADYLWGTAESEEWYQLTKRTFECTKNMMAVKVFSILKTHGASLFGDYIDRCFGLGQKFAELIGLHERFELATPPECNIVCFRYIEPGKTDEQLDELNSEIRESLLRSGSFYIVQTVLHGRRYLRTTLTNPFTLESDLVALLNTIVHSRSEYDS
ncbi:MAG: aspartate aminotransferase family protein [Mariniblastus sp.]